jgi:hypothetical protein
MPEHLIRLRGGWQWHDEPATEGVIRLVTLPLVWPADAPGCVRLVRAFHRPPLDRRAATLSLRLEAIAGLVAVRLNQSELARPRAETSELTLPLDEPLPARNLLVLEVHPPDQADPRRGQQLWGRIALVITEQES